MKMVDLWENYSFMLKKNGDKSDRYITVKIKDIFDNIEFTEAKD